MPSRFQSARDPRRVVSVPHHALLPRDRCQCVCVCVFYSKSERFSSATQATHNHANRRRRRISQQYLTESEKLFGFSFSRNLGGTWFFLTNENLPKFSPISKQIIYFPLFRFSCPVGYSDIYFIFFFANLNFQPFGKIEDFQCVCVFFCSDFVLRIKHWTDNLFTTNGDFLSRIYCAALGSSWKLLHPKLTSADNCE